MDENQPQNPDYSTRFREMAVRIEHNHDSRFGGAAVIIPPSVTGNEKPIELLMLDAQGDPAQFLATLITRLQLLAKDLDDTRRMGQAGFLR